MEKNNDSKNETSILNDYQMKQSSQLADAFIVLLVSPKRYSSNACFPQSVECFVRYLVVHDAMFLINRTE